MQKVVLKVPRTGAIYLFDVTMKEDHSLQNTITQHPVQQGASINDHVYRQPVTFTWDVGQSDCRGIISGGSFSTTAQAFSVLESLWANAETLTISTEFRQYTNMVIQNIHATRDSRTMNGMRATVIFQEVIVTSAVEISVAQKNSNDPQKTGKTNVGNKTVTCTPSPTIRIAGILYRSAKATYNGTTMSLNDYFAKYSMGKVKFTSGSFGSPYPTGDYTTTPMISPSVTKGTTFDINYEMMDYEKMLRTYKK